MGAIADIARPYAVEWLTSEARLKIQRSLHALKAAVRRSPDRHTLYYFHRVDDPICQLMVQVLPEFLSRFNVRLKPYVVEKLRSDMFPDPARYEAMSILDASRFAHLYGLGFTGIATVPDRLAVGMAARYLTTLTDDVEKFLDVAQDLGAALWRHDMKYVRSNAGLADLGDENLRMGEDELEKLGHYQSGILIYGGESYPGLERLDHLEDRLNRAGLGDGHVIYNKHRFRLAERQRLQPDLAPNLKDQSVDLFFSLRSPYSYIAFIETLKAADYYGFKLNLKPILPMVTRGLPLPMMKKKYIIMDAAREARQAGIPFGRFADPLGEPVFKGLALGLAYEQQGQGAAFFKSWYEHAWSKGNNGITAKGVAKIIADAGLDNSVSPLDEHDWQIIVEKNRIDMLTAGSWGVPTFRSDGQIFWGQDKLGLVIALMKANRGKA